MTSIPFRLRDAAGSHLRGAIAAHLRSGAATGPPTVPTVTRISPPSGSDAGGTIVTIAGTNLLGATLVSVGGAAATILSNGPTTITIATPAHAAGTVHTRVTTPGGTSTASPADQYTFTSTGSGPTVTNVAPAAGPTAGGTPVTITGTGYAPTSTVQFGASSALSTTYVNPTTLIAVAPGGAPGPVDITVKTAGATSGITPADVFLYFPPTPPLTHRWTLYARDANFVRQAQIEDFTACTFIPRWKAVGAFTLTLPVPSPAIATLAGSQAGIIIDCDGRTVFSGPGRGRLRTSHAGVEEYVFSGVDDNFWLAARIAHMQPHTEAPPYDTNAFDIRTGICSTVLTQYVAANVGNSALARRRIAALTMAADPVVGSMVTGGARLQPLLELLQELALASTPEVGFRIVQSGAALTFETSLPTDRSSSALFQAVTGTLGDFEYEQVASNANYIYGAGVGGLTGRLIAEGEDDVDIGEWGLVEGFIGDQSWTTTALIEQAIVQELAAQAGTYRTDLHVIDTAGLAWPLDYGLGDLVGVIVDGVKLTEIVREIQVDLGPNGDTESVVPSVSSPSPKATVREQAMFSLVRDLQSRVTTLERNQ